jgi:hypothetical protein
LINSCLKFLLHWSSMSRKDCKDNVNLRCFRHLVGGRGCEAFFLFPSYWFWFIFWVRLGLQSGGNHISAFVRHYTLSKLLDLMITGWIGGFSCRNLEEIMFQLLSFVPGFEVISK